MWCHLFVIQLFVKKSCCTTATSSYASKGLLHALIYLYICSTDHVKVLKSFMCNNLVALFNSHLLLEIQSVIIFSWTCIFYFTLVQHTYFILLFLALFWVRAWFMVTIQQNFDSIGSYDSDRKNLYLLIHYNFRSSKDIFFCFLTSFLVMMKSFTKQYANKMKSSSSTW